MKAKEDSCQHDDAARRLARQPTNPQLGPAIKELRRRQSLTLARLSELSGLSRAFLSQIENGRTTPSLNSLSAIAAALDCRELDIIGAAEANQIVKFLPAHVTSCDIDRALASPGGQIEVYEIRRRAGTFAEVSAFAVDCVVYVAHGSIELEVTASAEREVRRLRRGDSMLIAAGVRYGWLALDEHCAVIEVRAAARTRRSSIARQ